MSSAGDGDSRPTNRTEIAVAKSILLDEATRRSALLNANRFGDLRRSTLSWCRRIRITSNAARDSNSRSRRTRSTCKDHSSGASISRFAVAVSRFGFAVGTGG
jgi:hypothetical protein